MKFCAEACAASVALVCASANDAVARVAFAVLTEVLCVFLSAVGGDVSVACPCCNFCLFTTGDESELHVSGPADLSSVLAQVVLFFSKWLFSF